MGVMLMGFSEAKDVSCSYCKQKCVRPVKFRSHEDKKTVRICQSHWLSMPLHSREWDEWVAHVFPKWGVKVMGREWYVKNGLEKLLERKAKKNVRRNDTVRT